MKRLATAVATLAILVAAAPVHAVPVVITYSITGDSGQGIPGVLGGAPVQGGSVKLLWSMTSINGEFTGAAAILSLRLTNSFGTLSLEPTPVQQFGNANGGATILQVPARAP